jgi:hypothetical protein
MLNRSIFSVLGATICATAVAFAQAPAPSQSQQPTQPQTQSGTTAPTPQTGTASRASGASMTLVGCLQNEDAVPGRRSNVAERAGVLEDYILTEAKPASDSSATAGTAGTSGSSASSASAGNISASYKIEGIPDERLKSLVGKRVEVMGRVDADDAREVAPTGTAGAATPRTPDDDMPEFEATSIREVAGSCSSAK